MAAVHDRLRPFGCDDCSFAAASPKGLKIHVESVHLKLKNVDCPYCEYATYQYSLLRGHVKRRHADCDTLGIAKNAGRNLLKEMEETRKRRAEEAAESAQAASSNEKSKPHVPYSFWQEQDRIAIELKKKRKKTVMMAGTSKSEDGEAAAALEPEAKEEGAAEGAQSDPDLDVDCWDDDDEGASDMGEFDDGDFPNLELLEPETQLQDVPFDDDEVLAEPDEGEVKEEDVEDAAAVHDKTKKKKKRGRRRKTVPKLQQVDTGEKFLCDRCDFETTKPAYLERHVNIKHKKCRPYICESCGLRFSAPQNLSYHVNSIHLGLKRYSCPICPHVAATSYKIKASLFFFLLSYCKCVILDFVSAWETRKRVRGKYFDNPLVCKVIWKALEWKRTSCQVINVALKV